MLMQHFLSILCLIFTIYSCKCQDLEKFVAPILDNQKAPLVAIVDTTNISAHIVRSIERPLRNIINTTILFKLNEELKKDIVSGQVLSDVKGQLETLQQNIDKHIEENGIQITDVKQDIASLRMDTEETISHEIFEQKEDMTKLVDTLKSDQDAKIKNLTSNVVLMQSEVQKKVEEHNGDSRDEFTLVKQDIATLRKEMEEKILENMNYFAKMVNTVNKDLDEKVKNLTNNVEIIQSELRETILSNDNNASILAEQLVKHSNRLDALHSNIQDFSGKTSAMQRDINKVMSTANINNGLLGGHESRLDDLNAKFNDMNSRAQIHRQLADIEKQNLETENLNNLRFSYLQKQINDSTELVMFTAQGQFNNKMQGIIQFRYVTFSLGINNFTSYKSSGKFFVEKEGLYLISLLICSKTKGARFIIYVNGYAVSYTDVAYAGISRTVIQRSSNNVVIRQLHPNDTVWVYFPASCYIYGGAWSTLTILKIK